MYLYHFTQITPKIRPAGPQTPCKRFTHRTNLLLWLDTHRCFLTILKRTTVATLSTLRQPGSIQQLYIIHHTKWLSCTAIHCEKIFECKKTSRRSNLQKTEEYQVFFVLKLREIPLLSSIDRRQDRRKTGWWWWPLTSYCDVKKRISAVPFRAHWGQAFFFKLGTGQVLVFECMGCRLKPELCIVIRSSTFSLS